MHVNYLFFYCGCPWIIAKKKNSGLNAGLLYMCWLPWQQQGKGGTDNILNATFCYTCPFAIYCSHITKFMICFVCVVIFMSKVHIAILNDFVYVNGEI